jgi:hypothetical protein
MSSGVVSASHTRAAVASMVTEVEVLISVGISPSFLSPATYP